MTAPPTAGTPPTAGQQPAPLVPRRVIDLVDPNELPQPGDVPARINPPPPRGGSGRMFHASLSGVMTDSS